MEKQTINDVYEKLSAPFCKEAYSKDSSRGFDLTSLKAQFIKERLNEVLHINGWELTGEFVRDPSGILYFGKLTIHTERGPHSVETVGFAGIKKNLGDSYKAAQTDCLSKAASFIGVGNEVFKGEINPNMIPNMLPSTQPQSKPNEYIISFGKFNGKKLTEVDRTDLENYVDFLERSANDQGKPIMGRVKEFIDHVEKFLGV